MTKKSKGKKFDVWAYRDLTSFIWKSTFSPSRLGSIYKTKEYCLDVGEKGGKVVKVRFVVVK